MENAPEADFHMSFYNGIKVHSLTGKKCVEIKIPPNLAEMEVHGDFRIDLTKEAQVEPFLEPILKHCQECLRQCLEIEETAKKDQTTKFPLILKSSQVNQPSSSSFSIQKHSRLSSLSESSGRKTRDTAVSVTSVQKPPISVKSFSSAEPTGTCYMEDIGWCLSTDGKQFTMLFNDGVQLNVDCNTHNVKYQSGSMEAQMYLD
ncbi:hypothetical protein EDD86DRAFT_10619 [Gorgonomyces haynaldii]|nr:hypothetical protein EDD86DRAFT_10619 [Gorgonomyces haynaldii]